MRNGAPTHTRGRFRDMMAVLYGFFNLRLPPHADYVSALWMTEDRQTGEGVVRL